MYGHGHGHVYGELRGDCPRIAPGQLLVYRYAGCAARPHPPGSAARVVAGGKTDM